MTSKVKHLPTMKFLDQYLHARQAAEFDANDSRSLDLKYSSMVILSAKFSNE